MQTRANLWRRLAIAFAALLPAGVRAETEATQRYVVAAVKRAGDHARTEYGFAITAMLAERFDACEGLAPAHGPDLAGQAAAGIDGDQTVALAALAKSRHARWIVAGDYSGSDAALHLRLRLIESGTEPRLAASLDTTMPRDKLVAALNTFVASAAVEIGAERCRHAAYEKRDAYALVLMGRGIKSYLGSGFGRSQPEAAIGYLESAVGIDPTFIEAHRYLGFVYEKIGELRKAREEYRRVIERLPRHYWALRGLAFVEYERGDAAAAEEYAGRALAFKSGDDDLRFLYGTVLVVLGKNAEAMQEFRRIVAVNPGHLPALKALKDGYARNRASAELTATLEAIVGFNQGDIGSLMELAAAYQSVNEINKALGVYQRILAADPDNVSALKFAGDLHRVKGDYDRAGSAYNAAFASGPDDPRFPMLIAGVLAQKGDFAAARRVYADVGIKYASLWAPVQRNLAFIEWHHGEQEAAIARLQRLRAAMPRDPATAYALGLMYGDRERWEEALKCFSAAVSHSPSRSDYLAAKFVAEVRLKDVAASAVTLAAWREVAKSDGAAMSPFAGDDPTQYALPAPEFEDPFWPTGQLRRDIDRFLRLADRLEQHRDAFDRAVNRSYAALTAHYRVNRKGGCPQVLVGPHVVEARRAGTAALADGREFSRLYRRIAIMHRLGETAALTPEYRELFVPRQKRHRRGTAPSAFDHAHDKAASEFAESRSIFHDRLVKEIRRFGCDVGQLPATVPPVEAADPSVAESRVLTYSSSYQVPPSDPDEGVDPDDLESATVFFTVDNSDCTMTQRVFVDGRQVGTVGNDGKTNAGIFEVRGGPHDVCIMPDADAAKCALPAHRLRAFVHEGWSVKIHCK